MHLAAERGNEEIVRLLLEKSLENEEEENDRIARRRLAKLSIKDEKEKPAAAPSGKDDEEESSEDSDEDESDAELVEGDEDSDEDQQSMATGSFVKVSKAKKAGAGGSHVESVPETDDSEPDYYSKDVLAWDVPCSALHLAIVNGHVGVVKLLCEHAVCDVLTPVKFLTSDGKAHAATLSLVLALALPDEEKAREMTRLLLSLGASSAQADMKGVTALHRFVIAGLPSLIGTLFEVDSAAAKVALNTVTLSGSYWSPQVSSPLLTAIGSGDVDLVDRLLRSGASATIDFDTWLKAAKLDSSYSNNLSDITRNTKTFNKTEQPILKAVRTIWPSIALRLLEHGADPNTMTAESYDALANTSSYQYYSGATLLDVVRKQLKDLRAYKGEKPNTYKVKPLAEDMDEYLAENCEAGSYMHWLVSSDIKKLRETYEEQQKAKAKLKAAVEEIAGREEKAAEIKRVIAELEAVEKALLEKGAKTFKDLHPECKPKDKRYDSGSSEESEETLERPPKYKYEYRIFEKRDLTPAQSKAYAELFEACWTGDLAKIKALTLVPWDAEKKEAPLKMAVRDAANNTPFTIAWWRGHQDVARAILDIVHAQYSPAEKKEQRYRMREEYGGGSDEDEEDESDVSDRTSDAGNDLGLLGQVVDKTFTIENVGQVSLQVESHTKVTDFLGWSSPVFSVKDGSASPPSAQCTLWYHCVNLNDAASFKALLELAMKFAALEAAAVDEKDRDESGASAAFKIPDATFKTAIELGRTEILAEMIRVTGAGVPLEHLVKKSGAKMETKSRYYAGLTVYGKKR